MIQVTVPFTLEFETKSYIQVISWTDQCDVDLQFDVGTFCGSQIDLLSQRIELKYVFVNHVQTVSFEQEIYEGIPLHQPDEVWELELQQLLELYDLEPDSKWVMLTLVHFYQHLKRPSVLSKDILTKLIKIDSLRKGYYDDYRIII
jgi:hypothetical protein